MPPTVQIAAFVFGAILALIALFGKSNFEIFGAKILGEIGGPGRLVAGFAGVVLLAIGLINPFDRFLPVAAVTPPAITSTPPETQTTMPVATSEPSSPATVEPSNTPTTLNLSSQPTPSPEVQPAYSDTAVTLEGVQVNYDFCDTRGYLVGCEDTTLTVDALPIVTANGGKVEIPFGEIVHIELQPAERQHPEVAHWTIQYLEAVITLQDQTTLLCEIGTYLPLPAAGSKSASELFNTTRISDIYLTGKTTGLDIVEKISLYSIRSLTIDVRGTTPDLLGTIHFIPRK